MNHLIIVHQGKEAVSARQLHKFVESEERFSKWFERMASYGFIEEIDFTSVLKSTLVNNGAKRDLQDYALTIDTAKEIGMIQRNEKGQQVRRFFIERDKKLTQVETQISALIASQHQDLLEKIDAMSKRIAELEAAQPPALQAPVEIAPSVEILSPREIPLIPTGLAFENQTYPRKNVRYSEALLKLDLWPLGIVQVRVFMAILAELIELDLKPGQSALLDMEEIQKKYYRTRFKDYRRYLQSMRKMEVKVKAFQWFDTLDAENYVSRDAALFDQFQFVKKGNDLELQITVGENFRQLVPLPGQRSLDFDIEEFCSLTQKMTQRFYCLFKAYEDVGEIRLGRQWLLETSWGTRPEVNLSHFKMKALDPVIDGLKDFFHPIDYTDKRKGRRVTTFIFRFQRKLNRE